MKQKRIKKLLKLDWIYRIHAKRYCFAENVLIEYQNNEEGD